MDIHMARSTFLIAASATIFMLMHSTDSKGLSRNIQQSSKDQEIGQHQDHQKERQHKVGNPRNKNKNRTGQRLENGYRNLFPNFSYRDLNPPVFFTLGWSMGAAIEDFWWQGSHVCKKESEETFKNMGSKDKRMRHFSSNSQLCDETEAMYTCKIIHENNIGRRELTIVYACCHGYTRQKGQFGCPEKVNMGTLLDRAKELDLTDFVRVSKMMKLTRIFKKNNLTLFVPVNGAFMLDNDLLNFDATGIFLKHVPDVISLSEPAVNKTLKTLRHILLNHMLTITLMTSNMEDEQVLSAGLTGKTSIRINYFTRPEMLMTANCVPVISGDNLASNGVIHSVGKVLKPVTDTLMEIVRSRRELQTLNTVLTASNSIHRLDQSGQLTMLAPTNSAFDKLESRLKERLLNGDQEYLNKVLENHLLPHVICSVAIKGHTRIANQLHRYVNATRTTDNKWFINGAQVIHSDIMATNGVLHIINDVLVPDVD